MKEATLVLPFQLFESHPGIQRGRLVVMLEDSLSFEDRQVGLSFHKKRLVLLRAAMREYANRLREAGHEVHYLSHEKEKDLVDQLSPWVRRGVAQWYCCDPVDDFLSRRLGRLERSTGCRVSFLDTPMFLTSRADLAEHFQGRKRPFMARFYQEQRQRLGLLLDADGGPLGGRWSFDDENRLSMPKRGLDVPADPTAPRTAETEKVLLEIRQEFPGAHGDVEGFGYPVTQEASERWLDQFLEWRLDLFGPYEDAISRHESVLFHSVLTPMMNVGLLTPRRILDRVLEHVKDRKVPMASLEGFVRQVVGWREFMRGAYEHLGVACRTGNFWGLEDRPIPRAFYDGTTGVEPVDVVIRRVRESGYCHHIERLMILGNFMLLCGLHPNRVYDWFMEMFVDAHDWVMVPNVYGMSQFADGGLFTTKPYLSGSNYVRKMSDHGPGDWTASWDGLFWTFIERHKAFFAKQHRLSMMVRQWERFPETQRKKHRAAAGEILSRLFAGG